MPDLRCAYIKTQCPPLLQPPFRTFLKKKKKINQKEIINVCVVVNSRTCGSGLDPIYITPLTPESRSRLSQKTAWHSGLISEDLVLCFALLFISASTTTHFAPVAHINPQQRLEISLLEANCSNELSSDLLFFFACLMSTSM